MKFDEALRRFQFEIAAEYGIQSGVVKIALTHELLEIVLYELCPRTHHYRPIDFVETKLMGVQLVAREKDKF